MAQWVFKIENKKETQSIKKDICCIIKVWGIQKKKSLKRKKSVFIKNRNKPTRIFTFVNK